MLCSVSIWSSIDPEAFGWDYNDGRLHQWDPPEGEPLVSVDVAIAVSHLPGYVRLAFFDDDGLDSEVLISLPMADRLRGNLDTAINRAGPPVNKMMISGRITVDPG